MKKKSLYQHRLCDCFVFTVNKVIRNRQSHGLVITSSIRIIPMALRYRFIEAELLHLSLLAIHCHLS